MGLFKKDEELEQEPEQSLEEETTDEIFEDEFNEFDDLKENGNNNVPLNHEEYEEVIEDANFEEETKGQENDSQEEMINTIFEYSEINGIDNTILMLEYCKIKLIKQDMLKELDSNNETQKPE